MQLGSILLKRAELVGEFTISQTVCQFKLKGSKENQRIKSVKCPYKFGVQKHFFLTEKKKFKICTEHSRKIIERQFTNLQLGVNNLSRDFSKGTNLASFFPPFENLY